MSMKPARRCIYIGIVVSNIARSLRFYQGVLGLEKLEEVEVPFGRMYRLRFGESFVKLVDPKEKPPAGTQGVARVLGLRYLTFPVTNLDEVCAACEAAGVIFDLPKRELMPGVFIAMFQDPDGNVVELVERR